MLLSLQQVSKRFERKGGADKVAVDEVSLDLERGQIVGLFGPSGAGKTTLLQIAAGLQAPDDGEVRYDGRRLDQLPRGEWKRLHRQEIATIWAGDSAQPGLEVLEHVEMPLLVDRRDRRGAAGRAREALAACEAEHCAGMMLNELSDGERQRVAIARALAGEPQLLLTDEPTGNLDSTRTREVLALLRDICHEQRIPGVIVTHDPVTREYVDHVHSLRDGRLTDGLDPELSAALGSG
jgi:putative ABC transport system ATP-binding protein